MPMNLIVPAFFAGIFVAAVAARPASGSGDGAAPVHVRNTFDFTVRAAQSRVAPLFGADRERVWADGWDPRFLYPQPPADQPGAVFTVTHGAHTSTWVTTIFEPDQGHIQYVHFIPDAMVTLIDIRLSPPDPATTHVSVTYERTALSPATNEHVKEQGKSDAGSGPHWQQAIEAYLTKAE
jgi:hypothetical protein